MAKRFGKKAQEFSIPVPSNPTGLDKYEVEHAAGIMKRHQEIKANPKLHRAAKKHMVKEMALMKRAMKSK